MSDEERKELNLKAGRLLKSLGINVDVKNDEYDELKELGYVGYAHFYLENCWNKWVQVRADVSIYNQLLEIDSKLGTTPSEQLFACVQTCVPRKDLIEV